MNNKKAEAGFIMENLFLPTGEEAIQNDGNQ
jgi:hypothetical protein